MLSEFTVIDQLANRQSIQRKEVVLGIGDDGALLSIADGDQLVVSTDVLNSGVHFTQDTAAWDIGYKSLAVNLSDLAAMGALPIAVSLSLSMPDVDADWLAGFADGFFALANQYDMQLIGGDTTRGPLSISVGVIGKTKPGQALLRSQANVGDLIYVTGTLGDAGAACLALQEKLVLDKLAYEQLIQRLNRPQPRVEVGRLLVGLATACIDISDGLVADLGHLLRQSGWGGKLDVGQIPISRALEKYLDQAGGWSLPLSAGDDYELCFTLPANQQVALAKRLTSCGVVASCIGVIEQNAGLRLLMPDGQVVTNTLSGYEHFC